ncbi:MAG TPA: hypothetical protein PLH94_14470 [Fimbriimonadaceae bacterium]|nr:hypothetical protein [Fimbriimonadaceae bacterium]
MFVPLVGYWLRARRQRRTPENLSLDTGQALTMSYDEENRLTRVDSGATVATYAYDGDNLRRKEITLNGAVTTLIWDDTDYLGEVS